MLWKKLESIQIFQPSEWQKIMFYYCTLEIQIINMEVTLFFSQILIYKTQHIKMQTFVYILTEFRINKTLFRVSFMGKRSIKTVLTCNDYVLIDVLRVLSFFERKVFHCEIRGKGLFWCLNKSFWYWVDVPQFLNNVISQVFFNTINKFLHKTKTSHTHK